MILSHPGPASPAAPDLGPQLADHALALQDYIGSFRSTEIATSDGRIYDALAMPADSVPQHPKPPDHLVARPHVSHGQPDTQRSQQAERTARSLESLLSLYPVTALEPDNNTGRMIHAQARLVGFTAACPLKVHWLAGKRLWRCMGGVLSQPDVGNAFRLETLDLELDRGLIGLGLTLQAGTQDVTWHVTAIEWQTRLPSISSASTLGAVDANGVAPIGYLFAPLYAVVAPNDRGQVKQQQALPLELPAGPGLYRPFMLGGQVIGTVLPTTL